MSCLVRSKSSKELQRLLHNLRAHEPVLDMVLNSQARKETLFIKLAVELLTQFCTKNADNQLVLFERMDVVLDMLELDDSVVHGVVQLILEIVSQNKFIVSQISEASIRKILRKMAAMKSSLFVDVLAVC